MIEIPISSDPFQEFSVLLTGRLYKIGIRYNSSWDRFILDVSTGAGIPIVLGIPTELNFPIGYEFIAGYPDFPRGYFIFAAQSPTIQTLGFDDFPRTRLFFSEV